MRRTPSRWLAASMLGVCVAALAPGRQALADEPTTADAIPLPSLRLDLGPTFRPGQTPRPSFSVLLDAGVSFYTTFSSVQGFSFIFRPAIGYRYDSLIGGRHLGELGMEAGFIHEPFGSSLTETIGLSYRAALVLGSAPISDTAKALALGIRHGPALTYFAGILSLTLSHEYLGLPAPEHGLRVGLAVDLSPVVLVFWGLRGGS